MYLQRIRVPDFRVLKDVDISFEKELTPSIFPLGSLNGAGKSTLLQLIFVLLHCSIHQDRTIFLKNLIEGFKIDKDSDKRVLAIIDIWDGYRNVNVGLEFFTAKKTFIKKILTEYKEINQDIDFFNISVNTELLNTQKRLSDLERETDKIEDVLYKLNEIEKLDNYETREIYLKQIILSLQNDDSLNSLFKIVYPLIQLAISNEPFKRELGTRKILIKKKLEDSKLNLKKISVKLNELELFAQIFTQSLEKNNIIHICDIPLEIKNRQTEQEILLCQINNLDINEATSFMNNVSKKVFLAAPISQIFLFLSSKSRKFLFKTQEENNYYLELKQQKKQLPGFFSYDSLSIDLLIQSFTQARDQDFSQAIETGEYGNNYKNLLNDLNSLLINKKININKDLSGLNFKRDNDDVELYPEDLSHGELKRLFIYMWIKYNKIENAIVLMDEIEIAFHPDWQYQIVRDLEEWSPSNQYILATHSYELCQAVTPAHVKELPPKLIKPNKL